MILHNKTILTSAIIFFLIILAGKNSVAERSEKLKTPTAFSFRPHYGFVILHSQDVAPIGQSNPFGIGIEFLKHYNSEKAFNTCLCFPRLGVSMVFWNFDNPAILGYGITSVVFVEPVFGAGRKLNFSFRTGFGPAYASNPYHEIKNPTNLSYSTKLSFALNVSASINLKLSDRIFANLSANYNHISNGGMREPNKGINYPTLSIGLDYYPGNLNFPVFERRDWRTDDNERNKIYIFAFGSAKQVSRADGLKRYLLIGIDARIARRVSRINALNFGTVIFSDEAHHQELKRAGITNVDHKKAGVLAGNEFLLGRFIFSQQFGVYIYNPYKRDADVFQRYGINLEITKVVFGGVGLTAHGHVADFLELRLGMSF